MKKLISFLIIAVLLFTAAACARNTASVDTSRGSLSVVYDNALTKELLVYFQANQACPTEGILLDADTDYAALADKASAALIKDEAVADKLKECGWTEAGNWTESQIKTNADMFDFIVLTAPAVSETGKKSVKLLTDWLVGEGSYERTITTASGSCSCKRTETQVTFTSDAPELCKSEQFKALVNP